MGNFHPDLITVGIRIPGHPHHCTLVIHAPFITAFVNFVRALIFAIYFQVYVHVTNSLLTDSATVHWHGLAQRNTPYSDGAPYISQCPILPGTSFTYK